MPFVYRAKGTRIPLISSLPNMPSQHSSGALNTEHNEVLIEHTYGKYSVLSNTPTLLRPDADIEGEKTELSQGALVNMNTDTSADDKCVKFAEISEIYNRIKEIWNRLDKLFLRLSDDSAFKTRSIIQPLDGPDGCGRIHTALQGSSRRSSRRS